MVFAALLLGLVGWALLDRRWASALLIALALLVIVSGPVLMAYRARLREVSVGPGGVALRGFFGLNRELAWADISAVRFVPYGVGGPPWYAVFVLASGQRAPRVAGGPPVGLLASQYGRGAPAFGMRLHEFGGANPIIDAVRTFAPATVAVEVPAGQPSADPA
jgi:hypothetical protein